MDGLRAAPEGRSVNDIAGAFDISRPAISRHLRVLRHAGLVREVRDGRRRIYRLDPGPLSEIDDWLTAYRLHWAAALVSLKEHVEGGESGAGR